MKCVTHLVLPKDGKNKSYCKERQKSNILFSPPDTDIEIEFIDAPGQEQRGKREMPTSDQKVFSYSFIRLILLDHPFNCRMRLKSLN